MSERTQHDRRIDYVEFRVRALERAQEFYGGAFGWEFQQWGEGYVSFEDGRLEGGFELSEEVSPAGGPLIILYAADLEEIRDAILEYGGELVREIFEFPGGRRFHFRDPEGYELAVWSEPLES